MNRGITIDFDNPVEIKHKTNLSKKELKDFETLLLSYRQRYTSEISFLSGDNLKNSSGSSSNFSLHMADQGTENFIRNLNLTIASTETDIVFDIDEALRRIQDHSYGICMLTARDIGKPRLHAVPWTRYCVAAQEEIDKLGPIFRPLGASLSDDT